MKTRHLAAILASALAGPALAQDFSIYAGAELEHLVRPDGDGEPSRTSIAGYVEGEVSGFYFGAWLRKADNEDYDRADLYLGYRNTLDSGFSYDLYYYRYGYPHDRASDYGEFVLGVGQTIGEVAWVSLDLAYDPENELSNVYLGAEYYIGEKWTISANYGTYEVDGAGSEQEWDVGATYALSDKSALDLRWYDGTEYVDSYIGLALSFDTTILGE